MATSLSNKVTPIHWIVDWDGTLTKGDTLQALVDIAHHVKPNASVPQKWERVSNAYLADYNTALGSYGYMPLNVAKEKELLTVLGAVEQNSLHRVSQSGIFKDLTTSDIRAGATRAMASGQVQLRDGVHNFMNLIQARIESQKLDDVVHIISVNWSQRFIAGCLDAAQVPMETKTPAMEQLDDAPPSKPSKRILANELQGLSDNKPSTGNLGSMRDISIVSSLDKLQYLEFVRKPVLSSSTQHIPIVYVGDSWMDLECLLAADYGICIRDEPRTSSQKQLQDSLNRLGINCQRMADTEATKKGVIMWARDFSEIIDWMRKHGLV